MFYFFFRKDEIKIAGNSGNCSVASEAFGFGSAYTIVINKVSCQCCWMDKTGLLFTSMFSLLKKTPVELSLLPSIVHIIELLYVKQNINPSLTIQIMIGMVMI